jgi:hypothetical protein
MNAIQEKFKKIFSQISHSFSRVSYKKSEISPSQDWGIIVFVFLTGFCIVSLCAYYFDRSIENGVFWSSSSTAQSVPVYTIDQNKMNTVISTFSQKQSTFDHIKNSSVTVSDPSL